MAVEDLIADLGPRAYRRRISAMLAQPLVEQGPECTATLDVGAVLLQGHRVGGPSIDLRNAPGELLIQV